MDGQSYKTAPDASLNELLDKYCRLPQPLLSADELDRFEHTDLAGRTLTSLRCELEALKLWLPVCRPRNPWYCERVRRLREAIRRAR